MVQQFIDILCTREDCDITLSDNSWSICKDLLSQSFYQGIAIAKDVPRESLSDFEIKLYCLEENERVINYNRTSDATLTGNLALVRDGIIQRTGPGTNYIRIGPNEVEKPFSIYEDIALSLIGPDTEDGSEQYLSVDCQEGFCDIELADTSFSTCIENIPGDIYLGGLAKATGVPQDSLSSFDLPLYCAIGFVGINYNEPAAILEGGVIFLQGGILQRTGPGFEYFNIFKGAGDDNALTTTGSSLYQGFRDDTGDARILSTACEDKICEVILYSYIEPLCIGQSGRLFLNGLAINKNVPEDSLGDFEIGLYCVPPEPGAVIDYNTQPPISTINASIAPGEQRGIIRLGEDDNQEIIMFKISAGE